MAERSKFWKRFGMIACIIAAVLLLALLGAWLTFRSQRAAWTGEAPRTLPVPVMTAKQRTGLLPRAKRFCEAWRAGRPAELSLAADEADLLIAEVPDLAPLRGKLSLTAEGDLLRARVAVPLNAMPLFAGRYLNGDFLFRLAVTDGQWSAELVSGQTADGVPYPDWLMNRLRDLLADPQTNRLLTETDMGARIQSIAVQNGTWTVTIRTPLPTKRVPQKIQP